MRWIPAGVYPALGCKAGMLAELTISGIEIEPHIVLS
jgi:hypothetical protein